MEGHSRVNPSRLLENHPYLRYVSTLGEGSFGFVQRVRDYRHNPPQRLAVKFIRRGPQTVTKDVLAEIINHRELYHPHIVQLKEVFLLREYICIAMELAPGGNLRSYVRRKGPLSEDRARHYFQQLILAVDYCHCKGIANRDIKPENLCLGGDLDELLKISDFGYSKSEKWQSLPKTFVGTACYLAPEVICSNNNRRYDGKGADVWSAGVTLYVMVTGRHPFHAPKQKSGRLLAVVQEIVKGRFTLPRGASLELCDLIRRIFVQNPAERITIDEMKRHPWFRKGLPSGALDMTSEWMHADRPKVQEKEEIERMVCKAMREPRQSNNY